MDNNQLQCPPWFFYNPAKNQCQCYQNPTTSPVKCTDHEALLELGYCMTYDEEDKGVYVGRCLSFVIRNQTLTQDRMYLQLPDNVTELNDYMCGPMNRKGRVCSECIDGFAHSLFSTGYDCSNCMGAWYGIPLYLFLEFVPITIFYLIVIVFGIRVTSAPMTCFVMYSQLIVMVVSIYSRPYFPLQSSSFNTFLKVIVLPFYIWSLDFFRYVLPPFCISSKLEITHIFLLNYIPAVYSLCLIAITWACIKLYSRDIKPFVHLWNKLKGCCNCNKWENRSDIIIDTFATFFFLSYSRLNSNFLSSFKVTQIQRAGSDISYTVLAADQSIRFSGTYIPFLIFSALVFVAFGQLPALLLALYPVRAFRSLLFKYVIRGGHSKATINVFVEKFYSCYRDGLDGGRDMRSFASLYFLIICLCTLFLFSWTLRVVLFGISSLLVLIVRPFKKSYMNNLDALIFAHLALSCLLLDHFFRSPLDTFVAKRYLWSLGVITPLPLLVLSYIIFRSKCKHPLETYVARMKVFSCRLCGCARNKQVEADQVEELPDRFLHDGDDNNTVMNHADLRESERTCT